MKSKTTVRTATILLALALLGATASAGTSLRFFLPISRGMAGGSFSKLLDKLAVKLGETTGFSIDYVEEPYTLGFRVNDITFKQMKAGNADITYVNSLEYVEEEKKWDGLFVPAFTLIVNKTYYNEFCMYAKKGSGIKSVAGSRGKVWGGMNTVPTRLLLHENGIDEPLAKFFSSTKFVNESPVTNLIDAQAAGDMDVFTAIKGQMELSGGGSSAVPAAGGAEKKNQPITYETIACTEGDHGWIFGFNRKVPQEAILKITKSITSVHSDKNFSEFQFMFMAIKGKFAKFNPENLKRTREIAALKKKLGWDKEMAEFFKKAK